MLSYLLSGAAVRAPALAAHRRVRGATLTRLTQPRLLRAERDYRDDLACVGASCTEEMRNG